MDKPDPISNSNQTQVLALLDANLNRCREGLRVLDDFARFLLQSPSLCRELKELRHRVVHAESSLQNVIPQLVAHRNVEADAGTSITVNGESTRTETADLIDANARRVQESLRSLEEFGKLHSSDFAEQIKQIRYESYVVHQKMLQTVNSGQPISRCSERQRRLARLEASRIYVLLTEALCRNPWKEVVQQTLAGGADIIQLREKSLPAGKVVSRGRWIQAACRESDALFIMNDRTDLAILSDADGIHVGQDDLAASEVRRLAGQSMLLGLSTHAREEFNAAESNDSVDYTGAGPVFHSGTKDFADFPGIPLIRESSRLARKPSFAIGGIDESNVADLREVGCKRIAVCGAIIASDSPQEATESLRHDLCRIETH